ncbi:hypothetical protein [Aeromonas salmonicida]|jgi:hypothetical protein|uniref:hypothetical protein n=1 Tax=Aeromonas salmonicida TaxID=645 RepID=UPI000B400284|nr:hypothetical protein [Aeromonas salmonicida]ARW82149.1 hypothetical protein O23A_p1406 [Aeromonas salmonicida]
MNAFQRYEFGIEGQGVLSSVPLFHVCQECGGDGCRDCGSYGIVEGDIPDLELDLSIPFSAELELDFNTESGSAQ